MRAQIRGLEQAEKNIDNGISLVNTAESGLATIENPNLLRLRELAIQAANDTLSSKDRQAIQEEVDQILKGINDIANGTEFNNIPLLNGTNPNPGSTAVQRSNTSFNYENVLKMPPVGPNGNFLFGTNEGYPTTAADDNRTLVYGTGGTSYPSVRIAGHSFSFSGHVTNNTTEENGVYQTVYEVNNVEITQSVRIVEDKYEIKYTMRNNSEADLPIGFQFHIDTKLGGDDRAPFIVDGAPVEQQTVYEGDDIPNDFIVYNQNTGEGSNAEFQAHGILKGDGIIEEPTKFAIGHYNTVRYWDVNSSTDPVGDSGYSIWWEPREIRSGESFSVNTFYGQSVPPTIADPTKTIEEDSYDLILHTGANAGNQIHIQLADVRTDKLGIDDLSLLTQADANEAISKVDQAVEKITSELTKFGTYHNVLSHIKNNVSNYKMNITAAESRLRDLDIAKESGKLAKYQVLLQASQTMSAQSNDLQQSILEFLQ